MDYRLKWQRKHPKSHRKSQRAYYRRVKHSKKFRQARLEKQRRYQAKLKDDAFKKYGRKCRCCGISEPLFLTIHHKRGDGAQHRREMKNRGNAIYAWLKKHHYPKGFETLCLNCNRGIWLNHGICPHRASSARA